MKIITYTETKSIQKYHLYEYLAYLLSVNNIMAGPWMNFDDFQNEFFNNSNRLIFHRMKFLLQWICSIFFKLLLALMFLFLSTCGYNVLSILVDDIMYVDYFT